MSRVLAQCDSGLNIDVSMFVYTMIIIMCGVR